MIVLFIKEIFSWGGLLLFFCCCYYMVFWEEFRERWLSMSWEELLWGEIKEFLFLSSLSFPYRVSWRDFRDSLLLILKMDFFYWSCLWMGGSSFFSSIVLLLLFDVEEVVSLLFPRMFRKESPKVFVPNWGCYYSSLFYYYYELLSSFFLFRTDFWNIF